MGPHALQQYLASSLGGNWQVRPLGASGFCDTWEARGAQMLFVKTAEGPAAAMLEAEADGLRALRGTATVRVPEVACCVAADASQVLALEWLELVRPDAGFGQRFGEALAALHASQAGGSFGWHRDNFIGATPQRNARDEDWVAFLATQRLGPMRDRLRASTELAHAVDAVIASLPALFSDAEPMPSLIHGDLWQGNWGMLADGSPVVYDPAVSYADAEADLAMMELFGTPPAGFAQAYAAAGGCRRDARRTRVYQLYHLLNHAVLFGGAYGEQALRMARSLA